MGASERRPGSTRAADGTRRSSISKFGMRTRQTTCSDSQAASGATRSTRTLKNLATDWVDVYLVPWPDGTTPFEEDDVGMADVVREAVRFVGLSNFKRRRDRRLHARRADDVVQYGWHVRPAHAARRVPYCDDARRRVDGLRAHRIRAPVGPSRRTRRSTRADEMAFTRRREHGRHAAVRPRAVRRRRVRAQPRRRRGPEGGSRPATASRSTSSPAWDTSNPVVARVGGLPQRRRGGGQLRRRRWTLSTRTSRRSTPFVQPHG